MGAQCETDRHAQTDRGLDTCCHRQGSVKHAKTDKGQFYL